MENTIPMPHELRTQLNDELRAWKELRDKLREFNQNMDMLLLKLKETVPLLTNYVNNMIDIKIDPQDAEDIAVDIAVEQSQLENFCEKCGSRLIGPDSELKTSVCNICY